MGGGTEFSGIQESIDLSTIINGSAKLYFRDAGIFIYSDADGSLTIESDGAGTPVNINLKSTDGRESFVVRDNDGFPVVKLDTAGNVQTKGIVKRTTTDNE